MQFLYSYLQHGIDQTWKGDLETFLFVSVLMVVCNEPFPYMQALHELALTM